MEEGWFLGMLCSGAGIPHSPPRKRSLGLGGYQSAWRRRSPPSQEPRGLAGPSPGVPQLLLLLQTGMPRTLSASDMVTPGSLGPPPTEPTDGEQAGQPLLDGAPSSASLDTLIQQLVPTTDYYPEVGDPPSRGRGIRVGCLPPRMGETLGLGLGLDPRAQPCRAFVSTCCLSLCPPRKPTSSPSS